MEKERSELSPQSDELVWGNRIRAAYARVAARYDERWRRYVEESVAATLRWLDPRPGERVLDVACGTGLLLRTLDDREESLDLTGIDLSPEMLAVAARLTAGPAVGARSGVALVQGNAGHLPFATSSFDAVVSSSALHHWPDPRAVLSEIERVTRPAGRVVITDWCRDIPAFWPLAFGLSVVDRTVHHIYSRRELERLVVSAGYGVESVETYRVATFWGMMTVVGRKG